MPRLPPVDMSPQTRLRARFWPGVGILGLDLLPVALELLAHQLGEAGQRALAHLRAGDADDDVVVGLDEDPGADLVAFGAEHVLRQRVAEPGHVEAQRQAAAGGRAGDQELAAGDFRLRLLSSSWRVSSALVAGRMEAARVLPAAMWMAARMRW